MRSCLSVCLSRLLRQTESSLLDPPGSPCTLGFGAHSFNSFTNSVSSRVAEF